MDKIKQLFKLFFTFFKIGLFTFGGGLAMIPLISKTCVEKNKWITDDEMINMIAISESTPGVIAVNMATYIGHKLLGFLGSLFATIGVILPSIIIICIVSYFYNEFITIKYVNYAFFGIKACVGILVLNSGIKIIKKCKKNIFSLVLFILTICLTFVFDKTVFIILGGLALGIIYYSIEEHIKNKKEGNLK